MVAEVDPDGKAATLDSGSLTGYGVSKPLRIGAQVCPMNADTPRQQRQCSNDVIDED